MFVFFSLVAIVGGKDSVSLFKKTTEVIGVRVQRDK